MFENMKSEDITIIVCLLLIFAFASGMLTDSKMAAQAQFNKTKEDITCSLSPVHSINSTHGYVVLDCVRPFSSDEYEFNISVHSFATEVKP